MTPLHPNKVLSEFIKSFSIDCVHWQNDKHSQKHNLLGEGDKT